MAYIVYFLNTMLSESLTSARSFPFLLLLYYEWNLSFGYKFVLIHEFFELMISGSIGDPSHTVP